MAQDNEMGHYTCDGQGNRVCLEGFSGSNCSVAISSQLHVAAISTHLTNPTTRFPDSTFIPITIASISRPPVSQLIVGLSSHLVQPTPSLSTPSKADLSSHLVLPTPSNADHSRHLDLQTPSNADLSSHLVLPTPSNADLSSHLVLPTPSNVYLFSHLVQPTPSNAYLFSHLVQPTPSNAAFTGPNLIVLGVGTGVGGAVILLLLCTGVLSCMMCRKWCKCTRHKANNSVHGDSSVVMTRFAGMMSANQFYISSDCQETKPYRDPASTEDNLYVQLKENKLQFIPREMIEVRLPLGKGHFGVVDRGFWNDSNGMIFEVALKSLKQGASKEERVKLLQEAAIMAQFRHPNVLQSYREWWQNLTCTSSSFDNDLPSQLHSFSRDVAMGMCYLSSRGFIHRDLAARNILVTARKTCKTADFGMSRDLMKFDGTYYVSTSLLAPVKWTAPEAITDRKYSTASDVWSYGCLLYEIWSLGRDPYENIPTADVLQKIQSGYRDAPPPGCQGAIYQLMTECWQLDRHSRPSFKDIMAVLLQKESPTQPPNIPQKPQKDGNVYYNYNASETISTPAHESQEGEDVYYSIPETVHTPTDYYNTRSYTKLNRS